MNRVHRLFRPALYRRVHEPKSGGRCETRTRISRVQAVDNPLIRTAHKHWGEMRESNSRNWSHNPVPQPFGQSRHQIWSCWLDSHQHEPAYRAGAFVCRPQQRNSGAGTANRTRVTCLPCTGSATELYQRSWRGDSNADHGLTRPALFPLSYTSTKLWRWRGELHSR